ncbi:hypothetical protein [Embleya sp. AB8]|uniref:hypothetical protein n=1 Tax=Embleya sp. AB8 TaxID=3156304 RepID=UPI003C75F60B
MTEYEQAALTRLAAAAAERNRLEGRHPDPRTTSHREWYAYQLRCRAAGAAIRAAVAVAHRDGVSVDTIARTVGFSPGYVRMILQRDEVPMPSRRLARLTPAGHASPTHHAASGATEVPPTHTGPIVWTTHPADPTR